MPLKSQARKILNCITSLYTKFFQRFSNIYLGQNFVKIQKSKLLNYIKSCVKFSVGKCFNTSILVMCKN